jgi:hypothetical protein
MLKDSDDYTNIRNQIYKDLRSQSNANLAKERDDGWKADFSSYSISLIVIPEILE